jgi:DNA-binding phage protein
VLTPRDKKYVTRIRKTLRLIRDAYFVSRIKQGDEPLESPLTDVIAAWKEGRVTVAQLARRVQKTEATVYRTLSGQIDPPLSVAMAYLAATREIEAATTTDARESA